METYKWLINETFTVLGWVSKIEQESHDVPLNLGVFFLFRLWPSASSPNLMMDHHFSPATCFIFPTRMGHLWPKKTHSELRLFPGEAFQTRIVPLVSSATCQKSKRRKIKPGSRLQRPWDFLGFPTFSNHQDAVFYGGLMAYENSWEEKNQPWTNQRGLPLSTAARDDTVFSSKPRVTTRLPEGRTTQDPRDRLEIWAFSWLFR